jgi:hypothetical protein
MIERQAMTGDCSLANGVNSFYNDVPTAPSSSLSGTLRHGERLQAYACEFVVMKDVFGIRSSQLGADSSMELLQRIVQPTDWLLVRVVPGTWISPFFPLHADSVRMMDHAPGCNLHTAVTNQAQLLR